MDQRKTMRIEEGDLESTTTLIFITIDDFLYKSISVTYMDHVLEILKATNSGSSIIVICDQ